MVRGNPMTPAELEEEFAIHWAETGMDREPDNDYDEAYWEWLYKRYVYADIPTKVYRWNPKHPQKFISFLNQYKIPHIQILDTIHLTLPYTEMLIQPHEGLQIVGLEYYHYQKETK
jgi:hypothetical protein